jgi:vancomycin permeability regulator SanA
MKFMTTDTKPYAQPTATTPTLSPLRFVRRYWPHMLLALAVAIAIPPALIAYVATSTDTHRYTEAAQVPPARVAIVFGAGVRPDGSLSPMLADRVDADIALYQRGQVAKLLMSGDNSTLDYNEVSAMQRYAVAHGVPAKDITLDYAGFSTYESCYRANVIFGLDHAILVTQQFHLPRAVYTCRHLGIEASGLGTTDWGIYGRRTMLRYTLREALATLNALWQVHVTRPLPTFLGPYEGVL